MGRTEESGLAAQLARLDTSLGFLLFIIASVLLSFWTVTVQRRALCQSLSGGTAELLPDIYPVRKTASAVLIGSLGFFLCLALNTLGEARTHGDPAAVRSADLNAWAALLVLMAEVLRWRDLQETAAREDCRACAHPDDTEGGAL